MTSYNFSLKNRTSDRIRLFTPENLFNFKKVSCYVQNRSSRRKIDPPPHANFSNFQEREIFSFPKFFRCLDDKGAAATPLIDQFC